MQKISLKIKELLILGNIYWPLNSINLNIFLLFFELMKKKMLQFVDVKQETPVKEVQTIEKETSTKFMMNL